MPTEHGREDVWELGGEGSRGDRPVGFLGKAAQSLREGGALRGANYCPWLQGDVRGSPYFEQGPARTPCLAQHPHPRPTPKPREA